MGNSTTTSGRQSLWPLLAAAVAWTVSLAPDASALAIKTVADDPDGITATCDKGVLKIRICQADIVRVAYTTASRIPERPLKIVTKEWGTPVFAKTETGDTVTLQTSKLKVKIAKSTANVTFADLAGNVVLSETAKSLTPATVEGVATNTVRGEWNSPADEGLFGLGQHMAGKFNYKGQTEVMDQDYGTQGTAVPILVSTNGYGLFWDSYAKVNFSGNVASNTRYALSSETGDVLDYYFFYGPEIDQVVSGYRTATGKVPLFPKWAYGLIQSKDRYMSQKEILAVKDGYRKNKIPLDAIVQDWHYWDGAGQQGCYCFNSSYGNVKSTVDQLHAENIHTLISIWSELEKGSANYATYDAKGWLWPSDGNTRFIDAYNKDARETFWTNMRNAFFDPKVQGWDGWWFDNDEPFPYPDGFNRRTLITAMGKGVLFYNSYSFPMTEMFYRNWRSEIPGKRAVILHRANFPGQQAHSTMQWNNDIAVSFTTLKNSVTSGLNSTTTGIPYWTTDIGGYWGANADYTTATNQELMVRWLQYGAFLPIFRIHGNMKSGQGKELYSTTFTAATRANLLIADKLRYRLMPYTYSLAWMTTNSDYTPMRNLIFDFRTDPNVKSVGNQFMYGPAIMVSPVTTEGATSRQVYFPAGRWFDFWTGQLRNGGVTLSTNAPLSRIPLHVRAGSIVPMGPDIQYATERADTIELRIYPGDDGKFTLYEDQGDGYEYEKGAFATIPIAYVDETRNVIIGDRQGSFTGMDAKKVFNIVFVSDNHGTGIETTTQPDDVLVYTGSQVSLQTMGLSRRASAGALEATLRSTSDRLALPEAFRGKSKDIEVRDLSGKRVRTRTGFVPNTLDLRRDMGLPAGEYLVHLRATR
ncbi:MAG TPA: glycoside hydrolase family 31 protein [Fibrobacteria bacterium]|nr:glycoside hydrolase family 31 protein [Fibrobacteria bacterium]